MERKNCTFIVNSDARSTSNRRNTCGIISPWFSSTAVKFVRTLATAKLIVSLSCRSICVKSGMRLYEKNKKCDIQSILTHSSYKLG